MVGEDDADHAQRLGEGEGGACLGDGLEGERRQTRSERNTNE